MKRHFDRTTITLVTTIFLAALIGFGRWSASSQTVFFEEEFWAAKTLQPADYDIVIGGDSRSVDDFSPTTMNEILPTARIYNLAYTGTKNSAAYLDWLARHLNRLSNKKRIVIGLTPFSLSPAEEANSKFLEQMHANPADLYMSWHFGEMIRFFSPFTLNELMKKILPGYRGSHEDSFVARARYHSDGWAELIPLHSDPEMAVRNFRDMDKVVDEDFLAKIRELRTQGIDIVAVRPPTTQELRNLEDSSSGFDETVFAKNLRQAGGRWISIPINGYRTCDGSHLDGPSALQFSRAVAAAMVEP